MGLSSVSGALAACLAVGGAVAAPALAQQKVLRVAMTAADVPTSALVPAYMISELKTAFQIGFVLFIPFLVIDMATSSVLLSMGMMQLPPVVVSTPP